MDTQKLFELRDYFCRINGIEDFESLDYEDQLYVLDEFFRWMKEF